MEADEINDIKKAGRIAAEALEFGCGLIKEGKNALEVLDRVEENIFKKGGKPAFPAQISVNNVAAHCIPDADYFFKKEDIVKLDVGVHVNGWIGDNAKTIVFSDDNRKIVEAAEDGLKEALKMIKPGVKLWEIGGVIEEAIKQHGYKSVRNLSGHLLDRYEQHAGLTIPNYNNKDDRELEEGMLVAVEPFATEGIGLIEDKKDSGIYKVENLKNIRDSNARDVLKHITAEFSTLPFAKRWLVKIFPEYKVSFALRLLKQEGILHEYKQLWEKANGLVSQAEHTILVGEPCIITTKN